MAFVHDLRVARFVRRDAADHGRAFNQIELSGCLAS
ncbi:MAG: hypothetical protein ACI9OU_000573 [Candidatus Promineifilaceae bacterium]|jgi:hypothetical protein